MTWTNFFFFFKWEYKTTIWGAVSSVHLSVIWELGSTLSVYDKLKDICHADNERLWSSPATLQNWSKQWWLQCNPLTGVQINLWLSTQWCCSFLHHAQWNPHFTSCTSNSSHHFHPFLWANCTRSQFPLACIVKLHSWFYLVCPFTNQSHLKCMVKVSQALPPP